MRTLILSIFVFVCFNSFGQSKEERELKEFNAVKVSGLIDIHVKVGDKFHAVVHAPSEEDLEQVETEVDGKELKIDAKMDSDKGEEKPRIDLTIPEGTSFIMVQATGKAEINMKDIPMSGKLLELTVRAGGMINMMAEFTTIEASITASGTIYLKGSCDDLDLSVTSAGTIGAYRMQAKNVRARVKAGGDIMCQPLESLDAKVMTGGTIYYLGDPTGDVKKKTTLGGDIIYREESDIVR